MLLSVAVPLVLAIACELVLLAFLGLIGRFYEEKFGQRTYYYVYLLPTAAFVLMLAAMALGADPSEAGLAENLLILAVLAIFGVGLYRQMTGVRK